MLEVAAAISASISGRHADAERHLGQAILRSAIARQATCPNCGAILDCRRDMLIEITEGRETLVAGCLCHDCGQERLPVVQKMCYNPALPRAFDVKPLVRHLHVYDGRTLYGRRNRKDIIA